jgi:hypothetical protein
MGLDLENLCITESSKKQSSDMVRFYFAFKYSRNTSNNLYPGAEEEFV